MRNAILLVLSLAVASCSAGEDYSPRDGDIVFHTSRSGQSRAIQLATDSPYSHMGVVYVQEGRPYVFEAVQPVKSTPLSEWIARGEDQHFVVKRLRNADEVLTPEALQAMKQVGDSLLGKDYDLYFEWSDDRIYCSELVWKIFDRGASIQIGEPQTITEFDLTHPVVEEKIQERYGGPPPADEVVVSPAAMFSAAELVTVFER